MKSIYIVGCGGFARELFSIIRCLNEYKIVSFIDIQTNKSLIIDGESIPIISEDEFFSLNLSTETNIALGIGNPKTLKIISQKFGKYTFPNIIHPSAILDNNIVSIGIGNIITHGVVFTTNIQIGHFNIFNVYSTIGHDCIIGNYNVFNPKVSISGAVQIGDCNFFGVGSTILQKINIGNFTTIGACSLVVNKTKDNQTYFGNPAKILNF